MPITPVSLGASLRPWAAAGISHLLLEPSTLEALKAAAKEAAAASAPQLSGQPARTTPPSSGATLGNFAAPLGLQAAKGQATAMPERLKSPLPPASIQNANPAGKKTPLPLEDSRNPLSPRALASSHRPSASPSQTGALGFSLPNGAAAGSDPERWPQAWKECFAKTQKAPILWTYHDLGADMTGLGRSQQRSLFFRDLIRELRLPRGSSTFWPCALPAEDQSGTVASIPPNEYFFAGISKIQPQVIVIMGNKALQDVQLPVQERFFQQVMAGGKLIVLLPDIEDMLEGRAQRASAISFLSAVFAAINFP